MPDEVNHAENNSQWNVYKIKIQFFNIKMIDYQNMSDITKYKTH